MAYSQKGLVDCQVAIASKPAPTIGPSTSEGDWLAVSLRRQASSHNWTEYIRRRLVGCQPSQASQLPQLDRVHLREIGWLLGRLRGQASLLQVGCTPPAFYHSLGRALARLLLILLC